MIRKSACILTAVLLALSLTMTASFRAIADVNPAETQIFVDNGTVLVYDKENFEFKENQSLTETPMLEDDLTPVEPAGDNGEFYPALSILSEGESGSFTVGGDVVIKLGDSGNASGIQTWAEGGSAEITVTGNVTAEANAAGSPLPTGDYFAGAMAVAGRSGPEGTTSITVDGDAVAKSENDKGRVVANAVYADAAASGASTTIHITGNAVASSDGLQEEEWDETCTHAIQAVAENSGTISVTVDGKASAVSTEPTLVAQAVFAEAIDDPDFNLDPARVDVTVGGGAEGQVFVLAANSGSTAKVTIKEGGVTSVSGRDGAVFALSRDGNIQLSVGGDITATDSETLPGEAIGATLVTQKEGTLSAGLDGDITATVLYETEDSNATGLLLTNESGALEVTVIGDVTAAGAKENIGIDIKAGEGQKTDILIDGTVSASDAAVVLVSPETQIGENVTLTVWELVPNEDGAVVTRTDEEKYGQLAEDEAAEKAVQYIIRIRDGQQDIISANGTSTYGDYNVAHEGDTITLKLNIPAGCEITGVFADVDQQIFLSKDADGNYFLTVPRGGAVELSVTMNEPLLSTTWSDTKKTSSPVLTTEDTTGTVRLAFYEDGTYRARFAGRTETGTYSLRDGTLVLISSGGIKMAVDANRKLVYTSVAEPETTFEFLFTESELDALLSVRH